MKNQEVYENARKKVEARLRFRIHLSVYVAVMVLLFIINMFNSPEYLWFIWPLLGWGIGIFVHAMQVYVLPQNLAPTEEEIMKQVEKDAAKKL
ncbi:MAG: 2TM domain-containing protein [Aurantibacter sp.]